MLYEIWKFIDFRGLNPYTSETLFGEIVHVEEYTFSFTATRFYGLAEEDKPRRETITVVAKSFTEAVEQLRRQLRNFRGSNSFECFTVCTPKGFWDVITKPDKLFDICGILNDASFLLDRQLTAVR